MGARIRYARAITTRPEKFTQKFTGAIFDEFLQLRPSQIGCVDGNSVRQIVS
jgi:hypothetical protein